MEWFCQYNQITEADAEARIEKTFQETAKDHHVYKCIEGRRYATPRISSHPIYASLVNSFVDPSFFLLELGCCYGTDARKIVSDGLSAAQLTISDLHDAYFRLGNDILYRGPQQYILDKAHTWFGDLAAVNAAPANFLGHFNAISAQAILHVLSYKQCTAFLEEVFKCLKPGGSVLFGTCVGAEEAGEWWTVPTKGLSRENAAEARYLHSKSSLEELLSSIGYSNILIETENGDGNWGFAIADIPDGGRKRTRLTFTASRS